MSVYDFTIGKEPGHCGAAGCGTPAGALTVALVNVEDSPAAHAADICLPLHAGPELSVAATKSFIVSLVAGAAIVAHWLDHKDLLAAIAALPDQLAKAAKMDWPEAVDLAKDAESLYVVARGPSLPIATETALKLKETCAIHAEAYSIAEVMHGPLELLGEGFPVLAYSPEDSARQSSRDSLATRCARPELAFWWPRRADFPLCAPAIPCSIPSRSFKPPIVLLKLRRGPWPQPRQTTASQKSNGDGVMAFALTGARVFDGESIRSGLAVVVDGARIVDVVAVEKLRKGYRKACSQGRFAGAGFH